MNIAASLSPRRESPSSGSRDVFVARQPIFDRRLRVYGYELLFRSGASDLCAFADDTQATRVVMETAWLDLGMNTLVGDKLAFVNFTRELLLGGYESVLPAKATVIEILETVDPNDEVIAACRRLKETGYKIALDDFVYRPGFDELIGIADIIKIGFGECDPTEECRQIRRINQYSTLLAEKVETKADYNKAVALGFTYFQGWFFCRAETMTGRALSGSHTMCLKLIEAVWKPELDVEELEELIRSDVSLTHRFLKFMGSAAFGWEGPFTSVRHGLALLGNELTRRWVSLISLTQLAKGKPDELLVNAAVRAKVCEELGPHVGLEHRKSDLFFMGSLSLVDVMMDRPMDFVTAQLPLAHDLEGALLGEPNELRPVLDLATAYERSEWRECERLSTQLDIPQVTIARLYRDALIWANEMFAS